jgi:hypothetical protein
MVVKRLAEACCPDVDLIDGRWPSWGGNGTGVLEPEACKGTSGEKISLPILLISFPRLLGQRGSEQCWKEELRYLDILPWLPLLGSLLLFSPFSPVGAQLQAFRDNFSY